MWPFGRDRHARDVPAGETGDMERDESAETGASWVAEADEALPAEADGAALVEAEAELAADEWDELESEEPEPTPCPECGGSRIVANVRGDLRLAYRESMFGLGIMSNTSVYALVCRTCGLTTLYAYEPAAVFPPGDYE